MVLRDRESKVDQHTGEWYQHFPRSCAAPICSTLVSCSAQQSELVSAGNNSEWLISSQGMDLISCEEPILARVKLALRVLAEVLLQILFHRCSVPRHLNNRVR